MPILDSIASAAGGGLGTFVEKLITIWKVPAEKVFEHQAEVENHKLEFQGQLVQAAIEQEKAQAAINAAEATNTSIFVAGWRPFIGWVCGSGLAFQFIIGPIATWVAALCGKAIAFPSLDMGTLLTLLLGMLGLGGMRTIEKMNNAAGKDIH